MHFLCEVPDQLLNNENINTNNLICQELLHIQVMPICNLFNFQSKSQSCNLFQARILEWVAIPSPGELPDPGTEPRSPTLQADFLPFEPPGKSNI